MEILTLPGGRCFSTSEEKKLTEQIKSRFPVSNIQGAWIHYARLSSSDSQNTKASLLILFYSSRGNETRLQIISAAKFQSRRQLTPAIEIWHLC